MVFDIICLLTYLFAIFKGLKNGLIRAVFSLLGYVLAYFTVKHFSGSVVDWLIAFSNSSSKWLPLIVYVALFISVLLLVRIVTSILEKGISFLHLGIFNKIGGILFYVASLTFFLWFAFSILSYLELSSSETFTGSYFYKYVFSEMPSLKELTHSF